MPPLALGLAVALHATLAAFVWWLSPLKPIEPKDEPIMVSFDSAPSNVGQQVPERAGPPAEAKPAGAPPEPEPEAREVPQQQAALAPAPSTAAPRPAPAPDAPTAEAPTGAPPVDHFPLFEFSIPPPPDTPPSPTTREFARPPATAARVRPRAVPLPPRPSPPAQYRPPTETPAAIPAPLPGPELADRSPGPGRQRNDYLTRVYRHLEPYRAGSRAALSPHLRGRVVTRVTLARDGGVLDVAVSSSSGRSALDDAEVAAIRRAAPFPPLPANMPGDPVILVLRMTY